MSPPSEPSWGACHCARCAPRWRENPTIDDICNVHRVDTGAVSDIEAKTMSTSRHSRGHRRRPITSTEDESHAPRDEAPPGAAESELAGAVVPPARQGVVGADPAGVVLTGTDGSPVGACADLGGDVTVTLGADTRRRRRSVRATITADHQFRPRR